MLCPLRKDGKLYVYINAFFNFNSFIQSFYMPFRYIFSHSENVVCTRSKSNKTKDRCDRKQKLYNEIMVSM